MRAVVDACSVMTERICSVVSVEFAKDEGLMVTKEADGSRLWCNIWDSAANWRLSDEAQLSP